jgi:hypothetical protein
MRSTYLLSRRSIRYYRDLHSVRQGVIFSVTRYHRLQSPFKQGAGRSRPCSGFNASCLRHHLNKELEGIDTTVLQAPHRKPKQQQQQQQQPTSSGNNQPLKQHQQQPSTKASTTTRATKTSTSCNSNRSGSNNQQNHPQPQKQQQQQPTKASTTTTASHVAVQATRHVVDYLIVRDILSSLLRSHLVGTLFGSLPLPSIVFAVTLAIPL